MVIRHLRLTYNLAAESLAQTLFSAHDGAKLDFTGCLRDARHTRRLCEILTSGATVDELVLSGCAVDKECIELLGKCHLSRLDVSDCSMEDGNLITLLGLGLSELDIRCANSLCEMGSAALSYV